MSYQRSNESIIKQLCSGIFSGGIIGICVGRSHYALSFIAFTSIGLIDAAYHLNYLNAHITHLTYDQVTTTKGIKSKLNNLQRNIQRELRESPDDLSQELNWLWTDIKRHIDGHLYYGMGFTMAYLMSVVLLSKSHH